MAVKLPLRKHIKYTMLTVDRAFLALLRSDRFKNSFVLFSGCKSAFSPVFTLMYKIRIFLWIIRSRLDFFCRRVSDV